MAENGDVKSSASLGKDFVGLDPDEIGKIAESVISDEQAFKQEKMADFLRKSSSLSPGRKNVKRIFFKILVI